MGNKRGYALLSVEPLDFLAKHQRYHVLIMPFLHWLAHEVNQELKTQIPNAAVELIKARYVGPGYPSLGVYSDGGIPENSDLIVDAIINRLVKEKSVADLLTFIEQNDQDWQAVHDKLMNR
jgi:hypothetical protein